MRITTGTSKTTFDPNADDTRQDTCVHLVRFAEDIGTTLKQASIVNGTTDGKFDPRGNTKRSAVAKIFSVFYEDYYFPKNK